MSIYRAVCTPLSSSLCASTSLSISFVHVTTSQKKTSFRCRKVIDTENFRNRLKLQIIRLVRSFALFLPIWRYVIRVRPIKKIIEKVSGPEYYQRETTLSYFRKLIIVVI